MTNPNTIDIFLSRFIVSNAFVSSEEKPEKFLSKRRPL